VLLLVNGDQSVSFHLFKIQNLIITVGIQIRIKIFDLLTFFIKISKNDGNAYFSKFNVRPSIKRLMLTASELAILF